MRIKKIFYPVLLVLPALMVLTALWLNNARGPYWLGSNLDPEYVYLLNALNLAGLKGVGHIDHPGTPVQVLGAVIIRVVHFFNPTPGTDWHIDLLQRPEFYLNAIHAVLVTLNILILLAMGFATYHLTGKLWLSLWLQLAPFFSTTLLQFGFTRVTPEPLLFASSLAMVLLIIIYAFPATKNNENFCHQGTKAPRHQGVLFSLLFFVQLCGSQDDRPVAGRFLVANFIAGIISGFGIANKITFFPMMIIPLMLLPRLKNKLYYLAAAVISFVIFTLPIIRMYPRFFNWITNLLTHSGQYGSGPSSVISSEKLIKNIQNLLTGNPFFSVTLLLALVTITTSLLIPSWRKISRSHIPFKLLAAVTAAQVIGLLAVSKHSAHHYLLPVLNLSGITLALVFFHLKPILMPQGMTPKVFAAAAAVLLCSLIVLFNPFGKIKNTASHLSKLKQGSLAIYQKVKDNYQDYARIYYYRSSSPVFALKFGNDLSRSYQSEALEKLYKDVYFYDIWTKRFTGFDYNRSISFEALRSKYGDKIIFQGSRGIKIQDISLIKVSSKDFYESIYSASGGSGPF